MQKSSNFILHILPLLFEKLRVAKPTPI